MGLTKKKAVVIWVILMVFCLVLLRLSNVSLANPRIATDDPQNKTAYLKYLRDGFLMDGKTDALYNYSATVVNGVMIPARLRLFPIGCLRALKIDSYDYKLASADTCDRGHGIAVEVPPGGTLALTATVYDNGVQTGLFIKPESGIREVAALLFVFLLTAAAAGIFISLSAPKRIIFIVALAVVVRFIYLTHTPYFARTYDVDGHIDYIEYIAKNASLPPIMGGWEYYQPPLYYTASAIVYQAVGWLGIADQYYSLQVFSLFTYFLFLVFAYKILNYKNTLTKNAVFYAFALLLFWPTSIIHSVRIGNDAMLYAVFTASLYYGIRFLTERRKVDFALAYLLAGVSVLIKSNGMTLLVILSVSILLTPQALKWVWRKRRFCAVIILATAAFFLVNIIRLKGYPKADPFIANIANLNSGLRVQNTLFNMTSFDITNFISNPFTSGWDDATGRQQFFTFLWKTSLFSESFDGALARRAARTVMIVFLGLSVYALAGLFKTVRENIIHKPLPLLLTINAVVLLAISFAARLRYPYAPTGDFRYIFPLLVSHFYFFGIAYQHSEKKGRLYALLPSVLTVLFTVISILICVFLP